jgi:hypothetical protein
MKSRTKTLERNCVLPFFDQVAGDRKHEEEFLAEVDSPLSIEERALLFKTLR